MLLPMPVAQKQEIGVAMNACAHTLSLLPTVAHTHTHTQVLGEQVRVLRRAANGNTLMHPP